jgi:hypothetical protein
MELSVASISLKVSTQGIIGAAAPFSFASLEIS